MNIPSPEKVMANNNSITEWFDQTISTIVKSLNDPLFTSNGANMDRKNGYIVTVSGLGTVADRQKVVEVVKDAGWGKVVCETHDHMGLTVFTIHQPSVY